MNMIKRTFATVMITTTSVLGLSVAAAAPASALTPNQYTQTVTYNYHSLEACTQASEQLVQNDRWELWQGCTPYAYINGQPAAWSIIIMR